MNVANEMPGKVLVIDDERGPRESLRILLKNECHVFCADSVDAGLALLEQHHPDVIIMDIRMPGKNGIEGLRGIRERDTAVSVIMFTGFGALETAQEAIRLGANEYIKKPFDTYELQDIVRRHVHRSRAERRRRHVEQDLGQINKALQEELAHKNVLASMGQKSAELVHDLRNPLMAIMGYMDLLADELKQSREKLGDRWTETSEYMDNIEKSVVRCKDLSDLWLGVSRGRINRTSTNLTDFLTEMLRECRHLAVERGVRLVQDDSDKPCLIEVDRLQIGRAVQNLVSNAIEAVEPGAGEVRVWWRYAGEDAVDIGVEDNGCGMSPDQIQRAAQPFFTTKKQGGTGLGLFIARQAVEAHGGSMRIESETGKGTRIVARLPMGAVAPMVTSRH